MWRMLRTLENPLWKRHYFVMIFSKKCLTRGDGFGIIVKLARAKAREERSEP